MSVSGSGIRRAVIGAAIGFVVLTAAAGALLSFALPEQRVRIHVRWLPEVTDSEREELEQRFHLTDGRPTEGTTWRYELGDSSPGTIQSLVQHDRIDDTAHLNRVRFRPEFAMDRSRQVRVFALAFGTVGAVALFTWLIEGTRIRLVLAHLRETLAGYRTSPDR